MRVGVVVGLRSEAGCLSRDGERTVVRCSGARSTAAAAAANDLIDGGCAGLVSFGTAGGLDPALSPGALVIPDAVRLPGGETLPTDAAWRHRLIARIGDGIAVASGVIAGASEPLLGAQTKRFCHHSSGAVAVDLESGEVGRAAAARGVPFLVVRAVTDPADRSIPMWIAGIVTPDGRTPIGAVLRGLLKHPHDLGLLMQLRRDARAAMQALRGVALAAGPLFHLDG